MAASSSILPAEIERVASVFDEAPLEPGRWNDALRALASLTGAGRAELIGVGRHGSFTSFDWISDDQEGLGDQALLIGAYDERVNFRVAASRRAAEMTVVHETHYEAMRPGLEGDLYLDFIDRADIPFGCQTSLLIEPDRFVGLAVLKARAEGLTTEEQRTLFAAVAPRVRAAVKLQMAMEAQGRQMVLGAFDTVSTKALLVDRTGRVCAITPAADGLLAGTRRLWLRDGQIETPIPLETQRIGQAIRATTGRASPEATIPLPPLDELQHALRLEIYATPEKPWTMGVAPAAIVILQDGGTGLRTRRARLMEHHALTPAEADIALALARGTPRSSIAAMRQVSIDTIRTQLKTIYQKLNVTREAELVARIMLLLADI